MLVVKKKCGSFFYDMMIAVGTTNRQESLGQSSVGEITMQIYHGGRFANFPVM
jgi:hypothetical protein